MQGKRSARRSAVGSGVLTGLSIAAVSVAAALAGAILSRKFGHGVTTDGFFSVYAVYLALVLVANVLRVVVLPRFVQARTDRRLGGEVGVWLLALALPAVPLVVIAIAWPHEVAKLLSSDPGARHVIAQLLPWLVPAAIAQIYAGVFASALATFDEYIVAAAGFGVSALVGLALIVALDDHGVVAWGWGLAVNGALAVLVPLVAVAAHGAVGRPDVQIGRRLRELAEGISLPVALQLLFLICVRFADGIGTGKPTTFSYAYLIASFLVAVTASSVAFVSTVPFAREGSTPERAARHVLAASWLSLVVVAGAVGVFALAGGTLVRWGLGSHYGGSTGQELGRLVVYFAPWMVVSVAVSIAFPLVFVTGRTRLLPLLALAALGVDVLLEWAGREAFELAGLAAGIALTTGLVLAAILAGLGALSATLRGLAVAAAECGGVAVVTFALPALVLDPVPAAAAGLVLYVAVIAAWRPPGLRAGWAYIHALY
jgi:hypothetical protein